MPRMQILTVAEQQAFAPRRSLVVQNARRFFGSVPQLLWMPSMPCWQQRVEGPQWVQERYGPPIRAPRRRRPAASAGGTGRHRRGAPAPRVPRVGSGVGPRARKRLGGPSPGADAHAHPRGGSPPVRALATPGGRRGKRRVLCRGVPVSCAPARVGTVPRPSAWATRAATASGGAAPPGPFCTRFFLRVGEDSAPMFLLTCMSLLLLLPATSRSLGPRRHRQGWCLLRRHRWPGFGDEAAQGQRGLIKQRHQDQVSDPGERHLPAAGGWPAASAAARGPAP